MTVLFSGKLPKNTEGAGVVDPERWIPRRERSYFRGKRKDKRKDIGMCSIIIFPAHYLLCKVLNLCLSVSLNNKWNP